jgi:hypothetical protein
MKIKDKDKKTFNAKNASLALYGDYQDGALNGPYSDNYVSAKVASQKIEASLEKLSESLFSAYFLIVDALRVAEEFERSAHIYREQYVVGDCPRCAFEITLLTRIRVRIVKAISETDNAILAMRTPTPFTTPVNYRKPKVSFSFAGSFDKERLLVANSGLLDNGIRAKVKEYQQATGNVL